MAIIIGLTGGVGSGKSIASNYLSQLGVPIIDADEVARSLCKPNEPAFSKIYKRFGGSILNARKEIDRKKLKKIVFENLSEKLWLERLLHPLIIKVFLNWTKKINSHYCVVVAPLLLEAGIDNFVDRVLVIDCTKKNQIDRVSKREHVSKKEVESILKQQFSRKMRLAKADDVIINNDSLKAFKKNILILHKFYQTL